MKDIRITIDRILQCCFTLLAIQAGCSHQQEESNATANRTLSRPASAIPGAVDPSAAATVQSRRGPAFDLESTLDKLDSLAGQITKSPDDLGLLKQFGFTSRQSYANARRVSMEFAQQVVDRLEKLDTKFHPGTPEAAQLVAQVRETTAFYQRHIDAIKMSTAEIESRLSANPNDVPAMLLYEIKLQIENDAYLEKDPELALGLLTRAKKFLAVLDKRSDDAKVRETADGLIKDIIPFREQKIAAATARLRMLGLDAVYPSSKEVWINGEALTEEKLQGKVVLLDFWALWCGPCIEAFPHLSALQQEYVDDGLIIIAITDYYGYAWDKSSGAPVQVAGDGNSADEHDALEQYFRTENIPLLCVVDTVDRLSRAYHVNGRPHVVLIDRRGKVHLVRTGASKETLDDIEAEVKDLLTKDR